MNTSQHGIRLLEAREGIVLKVYRDSRGLPTCGCGHLVVQTDHLKVGQTITQAQCDAFLAQDLKACEDIINATVKVPLADHQFDACTSLAFNIGVGGWKKSSVLKWINKVDFGKAAQAFLLWNKPPEIIGRRQTEKKQFLTPY
jgi:lysozyme